MNSEGHNKVFFAFLDNMPRLCELFQQDIQKVVVEDIKEAIDTIGHIEPSDKDLSSLVEQVEENYYVPELFVGHVSWLSFSPFARQRYLSEVIAEGIVSDAYQLFYEAIRCEYMEVFSAVKEHIETEYLRASEDESR